MTGRRVVLLLNNPFVTDSRSWKIASSLAANGWEVLVVARTGAGLPASSMEDGVRVLRLEQPRPLAWLPSPGLPAAGPAVGEAGSRLGRRLSGTVGRLVQVVRYLLLTRAWADAIAAHVPVADVWQSEGLITLPVALRLRTRSGGIVVYDSRDLHAESSGFARLPGPWRRALRRRERRWARAADAVVTVNRPFAAELRRALGVEAEIVFNGPLPFDPPDPPDRRFHARLGLAAHVRVVLAVGALMPYRGIEEACEAIGLVPDAALVVVGDGPSGEAIRERAGALPHADRIHFVDALPPAELPAWTAAADVALMPILPATLNHRLATPTRLFDAMGAGVPIVASDLPGMAEIVRETGCGLLCDPTDPASIAAAVREVLDAPADRRHDWRRAGLEAARGPYAWDRQVDRLIEVYRRAGVD